jgi:hypothetical protein
MGVSVPWLVRKNQLRRQNVAGAEDAEGAKATQLTDPVDISSDDSFPASDPPSFTPTSGAGQPDRDVDTRN